MLLFCFVWKKESFPLEVALLLWSGVRVWFMVSVLKTDVRKRTVGSNPTLTA
nr:MAG TPA: hypothetical protein [Caudoviricetes sp.]